MTREPVNIDINDEEALWGDTDWKYLDYLENLHLVHAAFDVTRRTAKRFNSETERKRWERITGGVTSNKIPEGWVRHMIEWARDKNRGLIKIAITLPALTKAILNKANMTDWLAKNPQASLIEDLDGQAPKGVEVLDGSPYEEDYNAYR